MNNQWIVSRRTFLRASFSTGILALLAKPGKTEEICRFGMVTDSHYADVKANGSRYYRESIQKMQECINFMNEQQLDFLAELGDLKDQNNPPDEQETISFLQTIESVFSGFQGLRYYVLGNHDVDSISKEQFWQNVSLPLEREDKSYYSFDHKGIHFVVLDANFKSDGTDYDHGNFVWTDTNIPEHEIDWLKADLDQTDKPTIIFCHQLLDGEGSVYIKNAAEVRNVLETSDKVLAVFNGHHHEGQYNVINGIHYYTLKAMVEGSGAENNSYAIVSVYNNGDIEVKGYRKAVDRSIKT